MLEIDCIDDDVIGDELMGKLSFPIAEKLRELPPDARLATWDGDFPLTDVRGPCTYLDICATSCILRLLVLPLGTATSHSPTVVT